MGNTPFEQFILENLYNFWKEHGTSRVKHIQALIEECGFKEKNINKPLKRLVREGLVELDSYCAWITRKGIARMGSFSNSAGEGSAIQENRTSDSIGINFLKDFKQAISVSGLTTLEKETWLNGITQISHNPVLLKALEAALKSATDRKQA